MQVRLTESFTLLEFTVFALGLLLVVCYVSVGHITQHMLIHIGLMSLLAPLCAYWVRRANLTVGKWNQGKVLFSLTGLQLLMLWIWHMPSVFVHMLESTAFHLLFHVMVFAVAFGFWLSVFSQRIAHVWRAILALLVTGKIFCMVALLWVFSPRIVLDTPFSHYGSSLLQDQQLAGLVMITACPLTYVLAAILLVLRWLNAIDQGEHHDAQVLVLRYK
jgi:putative membrane protein